jgi:hypothetical protein
VWDRACFERALALCIREQPVLRTGYRLEGERALQLVYPHIELPLHVEDLRYLTEPQQQAFLEQWTERRKRHEFDWEHGPVHLMASSRICRRE